VTVSEIIDVTACSSCNAPAGAPCAGLPHLTIHIERMVAGAREQFLSSLRDTLASAEHYALTMRKVL
jgi:hypothetical protein